MIITIRNLTTKNLSTDIGMLTPNESKSVALSPEHAYKLAETMKVLSDAGKVSISTASESDALDDLEHAILSKKVIGHTDIKMAGSFEHAPAKTPDLVQYGPMLALEFTVNVDDAHVIYKMPSTFAGNPLVHVHWTKSDDLGNLNKTVLWRISYVVYNGTSDDIALTTPTVVDLPDSYTSSGTTTRIVCRTDSASLVGLTAGCYVAMQVEAVTPSGTPITGSPTLISLDVAFDTYIN
jgi:hypothetical protein